MRAALISETIPIVGTIERAMGMRLQIILPFATLLHLIGVTATAADPDTRSPESCRISFWSKNPNQSEEKLAGHCSATLVGADVLVTAAHCALTPLDIDKYHIVKKTVSCPNSDKPEDREEKKIITELPQKPDWISTSPGPHEQTEQDLMVIRTESEFKTKHIARLAKDGAEEKSLLETTPNICFRAGFSSPDPTNLAGTFTIDTEFSSRLDPIVGFSIGHTLISSWPKKYPGDSGGGFICVDKNGDHVLIGVHHGTDNKYGDYVNSERPSFSTSWFSYALSDLKPTDNRLYEERLYVTEFCSRAQNCLTNMSKETARLTVQMQSLLEKLNSEFNQSVNESVDDRSLDALKKKSSSYWAIFQDCYNQISEKLGEQK